jgi:hypothetical protein
MSGAAVTPSDAIAGAIRSCAKRSKSARERQKSIGTKPPSVGPEAWKSSPSGGSLSGSINALTSSNISAVAPSRRTRIPIAIGVSSRVDAPNLRVTRRRLGIVS